MKLGFLLGRAGTGKTHAVLQAIGRELRQRPQGPPIILLTPEQATFQMERALLSGESVRASSRAQVLSFERLAVRVMQAVGGGARPRLGELGKRMVLRALIQRHEGEMKLFGLAARQPGFVDKLARTLTELKQYRVGPQDLSSRASSAAAASPILGVKLHDLSLLYRSFDDYTWQRFIDPDDVLDVVAAVLPDAGLLAGAHVWVDGFIGFTPQELAVVRAIWRVARRMDVVLCLDPSGEAEPFAPTRETYERLRHMAAEDGVEMEAPVVLDAQPPPRFRNSPLLAHLERELFRRPGRAFHEPAHDPDDQAAQDGRSPLKLVAAASPRVEVEAAAREIIRLCRDRGWRYRDVAVIVRDLPAYEELVAAVFGDYGIPFFIDSRRQLSHHPLIELVRSALEAATGNMRTEAVVRCLKTDFFPVTRDEVDKLENYALEHGIDGRGWMRARPWRYVRRFTLAAENEPPTEEQQRLLNEINAVRDRAVGPLRRLRTALLEAATGREMATALWAFLEQLNVAATLEAWMAAADAAGRPEEVQEHRRAWQGVVQVLDEYVTALGASSPKPAEFRQVIEAGLETLRVGLVPPSLDQVVVGSVERSRQPDIRAAFILGAGDGRFPAAPAEDVIFTDAEREQLAALDVELSPTSKEQLQREQYLLYVALTRASDYVWISYPAADAEGKELAPSPVVRRLTRLFPRISVVTEPSEPAADDQWLARVTSGRQLVSVVASRLRRHRAGEAAGPIWWRLYHWIAADEQLREQARPLFSALNHHNRIGPLPADVAWPLFGSPLQGSVSRLETFAACAFQHFARYGLRLQERPRLVIDAALTGTFVHAALRLLVEQMLAEGVDWSSLTDEEALARADACVDHLIPHLGAEVLLSSARHAYLAETMRRSVLRAVRLLTEHARRSRFRPVHVELTFGRGSDSVPPLAIGLSDGRRLYLSGQIDRIDVAEVAGDRWVRVIDYKSSRRDLRPAEVAHGLSLQLPLYMAVVMELAETGRLLGGAVRPAALVYFPVRDILIRQDAPVPEEKLEQLLRRELRMRGLFVSDPDVLRALADDVDGGSDFIAASVTKAGTVDKRTNAAPEDDLVALVRYARQKAAELAERILAGEIQVDPFALGDVTACRFCSYRSVCQFDPLIEGNAYRVLEKYDRDGAWAKVREAGS